MRSPSGTGCDSSFAVICLAAGDGLHDDDGIAFCEGNVECFEPAGVVFIEKDEYVLAQLAWGVVERVSHEGEVVAELFHRVGEGVSFNGDNGLSVGAGLDETG